jgi:hypothetical protein
MPWIDQHSGQQYRITTEGYYGDRKRASVKTYDEVALEYAYHPESKCADAVGKVCDEETTGLLQRRQVHIGDATYIGKESNSLEEVEEGLIHAEENVYTEYPDPRRDEWQVRLLPALKKARLSDLIKLTGLSKRALQDLRAGRSRPHAANLGLIREALHKLGLI